MVILPLEEKALRQAFDALDKLKERPLSETHRGRLNELHAKISELLEQS